MRARAVPRRRRERRLVGFAGGFVSCVGSRRCRWSLSAFGVFRMRIHFPLWEKTFGEAWPQIPAESTIFSIFCAGQFFVVFGAVGLALW